MDIKKDDRILLSTRIVSALVVPFLVLAFIILYFYPETSGERFAWEIKPNMTAAFMGSGYLGGSWLFINAVFGRRWHRISTGFLPVAAFTTAMMVTTVLHWDRFEIGHLPFTLWLILYAVTPFLLPVLWWLNHKVDFGAPESNDPSVPKLAGLLMKVFSAALLLFAAWAFILPENFSTIWPWRLSPLTARIVGGWFVLMGAAGLYIARDSRWSSWRIGLECIWVWHVLILFAAFTNRADFPGGLLNWYIISVVLVLTGMTALYAWIEVRRRSKHSTLKPLNTTPA